MGLQDPSTTHESLEGISQDPVQAPELGQATPEEVSAARASTERSMPPTTEAQWLENAASRTEEISLKGDDYARLRASNNINPNAPYITDPEFEAALAASGLPMDADQDDPAVRAVLREYFDKNPLVDLIDPGTVDSAGGVEEPKLTEGQEGMAAIAGLVDYANMQEGQGEPIPQNPEKDPSVEADGNFSGDTLSTEEEVPDSKYATPAEAAAFRQKYPSLEAFSDGDISDAAYDTYTNNTEQSWENKGLDDLWGTTEFDAAVADRLIDGISPKDSSLGTPNLSNDSPAKPEPQDAETYSSDIPNLGSDSVPPAGGGRIKTLENPLPAEALDLNKNPGEATYLRRKESLVAGINTLVPRASGRLFDEKGQAQFTIEPDPKDQYKAVLTLDGTGETHAIDLAAFSDRVQASLGDTLERNDPKAGAADFEAMRKYLGLPDGEGGFNTGMLAAFADKTRER